MSYQDLFNVKQTKHIKARENNSIYYIENAKFNLNEGKDGKNERIYFNSRNMEENFYCGRIKIYFNIRCRFLFLVNLKRKFLIKIILIKRLMSIVLIQRRIIKYFKFNKT